MSVKWKTSNCHLNSKTKVRNTLYAMYTFESFKFSVLSYFTCIYYENYKCIDKIKKSYNYIFNESKMYAKIRI